MEGVALEQAPDGQVERLVKRVLLEALYRIVRTGGQEAAPCPGTQELTHGWREHELVDPDRGNGRPAEGAAQG